MALITLQEILKDAHQKRYGVGLFNILDLQMLRGIMEAAEQEHAPVIIGVAEVHLPILPFSWASYLMAEAARRLRVPVCLHFDHGMTTDAILAAIHAGFTSVMYDGSALPFEENVKNTRAIVQEAKKYGVSVEAELGHVGMGDDMDDMGSMYTNAEDVVSFVEQTGVDALAVAIGTAHGQYRRKPVLDIERLQQIREITPVPLVLHGGSGLTDDDFRTVVQNGISKVNICTDMCIASAEAAESHPVLEKIIPAQVEAVKETVVHKIRVFDSADRA